MRRTYTNGTLVRESGSTRMLDAECSDTVTPRIELAVLGKHNPPEIFVRFVRTGSLVWRRDAERFATNILDESELHVAERLRDDHVRHDYVAAHVLARMTLADASRTRPAAIRYRQLGIGRAEVAGPRRARQWQFSVSHTGGVAVCAVAQGPVGAGVGCVAGMLNQRELADNICTAGERETLAGLQPAARQQQLLRLWTCKEAIAKADGRGTRVRYTDISADGAVGAIHGNDREWFIASTWVTPYHLATVAVGADAAHNAQMSFNELM